MEQTIKKETSLEDKRKLFAQSGLIIVAVLLLCYFFGWTYIWNTGYGAEVGVNGWNYLIVFFSKGYKNVGAAFGDISHPFYSWAKYYTLVVSTMTFASFVILLAYLGLSIANSVKYKKVLELVTIIVLYALAIAYLACIISALVMNGSKILAKYCSNNPQCSIATLAFFPFFITLITAIAHTVFYVKNERE